MNLLEIQQRVFAFERFYIEHPRVQEAELAILDLELRRAAPSHRDGEILCTLTESENTFRFDAEHSSLEDEDNHLTQYCVLISGEAGSGKSRFLDRIVAKEEFKAILSGPDGDILPLLHFDMPNTATPKAFLEELCEKAGLPLPRKITRNELARRLRDQLKKIGTRLIMIDEAHTLVEGKRDEAVLAAARTLKFLLNTCGVPIVLLGEKPLARLEASKALKRRIDAHISLNAYSWSHEDDRFEFLDYLDKLDEALGFGTRSELAENDDLASRLYFVANGHIGLVAKYLAKALKYALRAELDQIDVKLLARAYREIHPVTHVVLGDPDEILEPAGDNLNPFAVDRAQFKKMWADRYDPGEVPDTSSTVKRLKGTQKVENVFGND